jgi:ABC-type Na+ efflux pump permease subunit
MYPRLLILHSLLRWLLVLMLVYMLVRAWLGYKRNFHFTSVDNTLRHWTATIAHLQLTVGMVLYFKSPYVAYFWKKTGPEHLPLDYSFFSLIHISLMILAVAVLTVGSAMTKRKATDREKFKTVFSWFLVAFVILFIAIPWPFSPLVKRPVIRFFNV